MMDGSCFENFSFKIRMALKCILDGAYATLLVTLGVCCSSWITTSNGSTKRSFLTPMGCTDYASVRIANQMVSRSLIHKSVIYFLWFCLDVIMFCKLSQKCPKWMVWNSPGVCCFFWWSWQWWEFLCWSNRLVARSCCMREWYGYNRSWRIWVFEKLNWNCNGFICYNWLFSGFCMCFDGTMSMAKC